MNACLQVRNTISCIRTHWVCVSTVPFSKPVNMNIGEKEKTASKILSISMLLFHVLSVSDVSLIHCDHSALHYLHSTADCWPLLSPSATLIFMGIFVHVCCSSFPAAMWSWLLWLWHKSRRQGFVNPTPVLWLFSTKCCMYDLFRVEDSVMLWTVVCMLFSILM